MTRAINALARAEAEAAKPRIWFRRHAEDRMDERDIDHEEVMTCLRKGKAGEPYVENDELRTNVIHRGLSVRVVIGDIQHAESDWTQLNRCAVVTVIEAN